MPYTYLIGWKNQNKWYYGVRYSKKCSPDDLWIKYFTSSSTVKEFTKQHGDPDVISIRRKFDCPNKAKLWEETVLRKMNVLHDDKWLNKNINGRAYIKEQTEIHKKKISLANKGRIFSQEHKEKLRQAKLGKKISPEHAAALHEGRRNSKNSPEHREAIRKYQLGRKK